MIQLIASVRILGVHRSQMDAFETQYVCVSFNLLETVSNISKLGLQIFYLEEDQGKKKIVIGTSPVLQWLRHYAFTAAGSGFIPGQGIKIPQALGCNQKIEKENGNNTNGAQIHGKSKNGIHG